MNGRAFALCVAIGCRGSTSAGNDSHIARDVIPVDGYFVPPPTCIDTSALPTWRQGMAIGEWKALDSADLSQVTPDVMPSGGYYGRIDAWNGIASDLTSAMIYLGAAGGHADYAGNEVYALDLSAAAPQWTIELQPSPMSAYTIDEPYYTDGRPSPEHTYYTEWFIEQRGKLFRFGGAGVWGTGNGGTSKIDSWDPSTKNWDPAGTNPDIGPNPTYEMPVAKDVVTGDVYELQSDNHLYHWNQAENTSEDLGNAAGGTDSFYDLSRSPSVVVDGQLYFFSDTSNDANQMRLYTIATNTWTTPIALGPAAAEVTAVNSQAMAHYDFCAKTVIIKTNDTSAVFELEPTTMMATSFPTTGDVPPSPLNGVHTLFTAVPTLGGYAYQPTAGSKLYFFATQ